MFEVSSAKWLDRHLVQRTCTNKMKVSSCLTHSYQQFAVRNSSAANSVHVPHQQTLNTTVTQNMKILFTEQDNTGKRNCSCVDLLRYSIKILIGNIYLFLFIYLFVRFCSHWQIQCGKTEFTWRKTCYMDAWYLCGRVYERYPVHHWASESRIAILWHLCAQAFCLQPGVREGFRS